MSTRISKTSSYEQVAQEDNECDDHKDQGIKDPDDNLPSLNSNQSTQSSAAIIASFEEISSEAYEKQKVIKHRKDKGKIDKKEATSQLKQAYKTLAHTLTKDDLSLEYNTDLTNGLTSDQVNKLYTTIGYNELIPPKQDPGWLKFLKCTFGNLLSVFWCCSGILSFILYIIDPRDPPDESSLFLGILMLLVVVGTGGFIFYFEGKSSNLMSTLGAIKPKSIIVIRNNGVKQEVDPRELVPGDIICIQMGMLIPADLRVIECSSDLQVDNSSLTGLDIIIILSFRYFLQFSDGNSLCDILFR